MPPPPSPISPAPASPCPACPAPWPSPPLPTCRTDPKGAGAAFLVHGQACLKSTIKPKCSFEGGAAPPAKLFQLSIKELMGGDWRVRRAGVLSCTCVVLPPQGCAACMRWGRKRGRGRRACSCPPTTSSTPPPDTHPIPPTGLQRRHRLHRLRDGAGAGAWHLPPGRKVHCHAAQARRRLLQPRRRRARAQPHRILRVRFCRHG